MATVTRSIRKVVLTPKISLRFAAAMMAIRARVLLDSDTLDKLGDRE